MDRRETAVNGKLLLLANVLLAAAVAGGVGYGSGLWWEVLGFEPDLWLRAHNLRRIVGDGVLQFGAALMVYGLVRSLAGGAKAAWFVWAGFGAAALGILAGSNYLFSWQPEWAFLSAAVFDIALVGLVFFAARLAQRERGKVGTAQEETGHGNH